MDLRYNPEKCIRQNLDPKHTLPKRTSQNLTLKCYPEKRTHLTLTPKHTLSKRTPQNLTKKAILKNIPHESLPSNAISTNVPA